MTPRGSAPRPQRRVQLIGLVLLLVGCQGPASRSCALGGVCPTGLRCVSAGGADMCVLPTCGDGQRDPGESCDDGNNVSGDGCPATCVVECGDGIVDADEACDDGNTVSGDGCSADCRTTEACGNGVLDVGEACDDGGLISHDGCSARCTRETPVWQALDTRPPSRANHAMAYDAAHGTVVLFGGRGALGVLGDTWIWDGVLWRRLDPGTAPPPRKDHAMAYDARRKRVVLFGGAAAEHSTWEWDGVRWIELQPMTTPPSLAGSAMAYDRVRHRVVLFGGALDGAPQNATWEWDGDEWRQIATATAPPPRAGHAMAYDGVRGRIVLFGGIGDGARQRDTWEYDGTDWTPRAVAPAPAARTHAAIAFDGERIVLFGGEGDAGLLEDSWTWDGTQWSPAQGPGPGAREAAAMAYDAMRAQLVLFGGEQLLDPAVTGAGLSSETWSRRHAAWTARTTYSELPESRTNAGLAYDPRRGRTVLFGGLRSGLVPNMPTGVTRDLALDDTWAWDGRTWDRIASPTAPTPRWGFTMAFDGNHVVLFGGNEIVEELSRPMNDTWVLVDAQWQRQSPGAAPSPRFDAGTAYDPQRGRLVLFGGTSGGNKLADTWEWDGVHWEQRFPVHTPPERIFPAMAFDPVQGHVLMFGGTAPAAPTVVMLDDTWMWDGDDWIPQTTTSAPAAGAGHAIAEDPVRQTILVFDGTQPTSSDNDGRTWEWEGSDWHLRTPAISPRQQHGVALAYDAARDRMVMFGGSRSASGGSVVAEWDGNDWRDVTPISHLPSPRARPAAVYDADHGAVLMFGGGVGGDLNNPPPLALTDTWMWDGTAWGEQHPAASPLAAIGHSIAYDSDRRRAVIVPDTGDAETWEWDGASWLERAAGSGPTPRTRPAMVYDAARHQTLLIGGAHVFQPVFEQWVWDGERWTQRLPSAPFAQIGAAAAYDADRQRVVLFGGGAGGRLENELWEWTGDRWIQRPATGPWPPARTGHTLVYDPARRRTVLFGGRTEQNFVLNDLWEWDGTSWQQIKVPAPPPRADHAMVYDAARRALVLFGGNDSWKDLQDVWLLRYSDPATPDEVSP